MDGTSDLGPPLVRHPKFDVLPSPARSMVLPAQLARKQPEGREKEDLEVPHLPTSSMTLARRTRWMRDTVARARPRAYRVSAATLSPPSEVKLAYLHDPRPSHPPLPDHFLLYAAGLPLALDPCPLRLLPPLSACLPLSPLPSPQLLSSVPSPPPRLLGESRWTVRASSYGPLPLYSLDPTLR
ncbi:hypothetical protein C8Q76DRAFT_244283 [Earliella scabrosa]|nr:hypothetical protein C8Q76DRAFT_244283 [Earliella scabrosa]